MHRLRTLLVGTIGAIILSYILHLPWKLAEAAIFEAINHKIATWAGPMSPAFQYALTLGISWIPPIAVAAACVWLIYRTGFSHGTRVASPISPPGDIVAATETTPRGAKLITLGQYVILGSGIVGILGVSFGIALILIGDSQR